MKINYHWERTIGHDCILALIMVSVHHSVLVQSVESSIFHLKMFHSYEIFTGRILIATLHH